MEQITLSDGTPVTIDELVKLAALDSILYSQIFFPKAARQSSPPFHRSVWNAFEDPAFRYANLQMFRGSAKTTLSRLFISKRVAYRLSRTILLVGASESHAVRSVQWLRNNVERNQLWASTFGLKPGRKWQETEIEIISEVDGSAVWILAVGITGNIRGINFDDYRPDLIFLDDVITDENAVTEEQREKINDLIHGAVRRSLASIVDEPNAKMVMCQTPRHIKDASCLALGDPLWTSIQYPCWTPETLDLPIEQQQSSWAEMLPSEELRKEKLGYIQQNRLSLFLREMECRLISPETSSFRPEWLQYYAEAEKPQGLYCVVAVDPVPPPTEKQMAKQLKGKDYEAICVWGRRGPDYYLLDLAVNRGHQPNWTVAKVLEFAFKYRAAKIIVEQVGYQAALRSLLEVEMARRQVFWPVVPVPDKRKKFARITTTLSGPASQGHIWVNMEKHSEFVEQFSTYGPTFMDHDDVLDASAMALSDLINPYLELGPDAYTEVNVPEIADSWRTAP